MRKVVTVVVTFVLGVGALVGVGAAPAWAGDSADTYISTLKSGCASYDLGVVDDGTLRCYSGVRYDELVLSHVQAICDGHAQTSTFVNTANVQRTGNLGPGQCVTVSHSGGEAGTITSTMVLNDATTTVGTVGGPPVDTIASTCDTVGDGGVRIGTSTFQCVKYSPSNLGVFTYTAPSGVAKACNIHATLFAWADDSVPERTTTFGTGVCLYLSSSGDSGVLTITPAV